MSNNEFERVMRNRLIEIPLKHRKTWNITDLYRWWVEEKMLDAQIQSEDEHADQWRHVPMICRDLIGQSAVW